MNFRKSININYHFPDLSQYKKYKYGLISSYVSSFLAYGFILTNKLINHDDIFFTFGHGWDIENGRWGVNILESFIPDYSMPWLNGIIALFFLGITVVLILSVFQLENKFLQCVTASAISVFPSWTGVLYYNFTVIQFAIALFLAVFMVKLVHEGKHVKSIVCGICMLSIYQAYICVTSSFLIVLLMKYMLNKEVTEKEIVSKSLLFFLDLAIAAIAYYGITLLIQNLSGIFFNLYSTNRLSQNIPILERLDIAHSSIIDLICNGKDGVIWGKPSVIAHVVLFIVSISIGFYSINTTYKHIYFILYGLVLLPISINGLYLILGPSSVHALTYLGFISVYVLAAVSFSTLESTIPRILIPICLCFITVCSISYSNIMAFKQYLDYENTYSIYTSIITQIQMNTDYTPGTKIALCGDIPDSRYIGEFDGAVMVATAAIRNQYSIPEFITYYIGFDAEYATDEEKAPIMDSLEYSSMPSYPYNGFIKKIGETMVVKFS